MKKNNKLLSFRKLKLFYAALDLQDKLNYQERLFKIKITVEILENYIFKI